MDGGDGDAVGGDVVGFFGAVVFGDPVADHAAGPESVFDESGQGGVENFSGILHGIEHGNFRIGAVFGLDSL